MISQSCADNCNRFISGYPDKLWRRNGKTQRWKRDTLRFRIPVKHGMYFYDQITQNTQGVWCEQHANDPTS